MLATKSLFLNYTSSSCIPVIFWEVISGTNATILSPSTNPTLVQYEDTLLVDALIRCTVDCEDCDGFIEKEFKYCPPLTGGAEMLYHCNCQSVDPSVPYNYGINGIIRSVCPLDTNNVIITQQPSVGVLTYDSGTTFLTYTPDLTHTTGGTFIGQVQVQTLLTGDIYLATITIIYDNCEAVEILDSFHCSISDDILNVSALRARIEVIGLNPGPVWTDNFTVSVDGAPYTNGTFNYVWTGTLWIIEWESLSEFATPGSFDVQLKVQNLLTGSCQYFPEYTEPTGGGFMCPGW